MKDFALWKSAKEADIKAEAVFDSPWGKGRPGWHIECSVMSAKYLGVPFDIHGGGKDLIFPHHENERAQSYARFGVEPVKIWVHNDFIRIKGEKMSKSLGNIVRIRDVLQKYDGEVLRYFLLLAHYRSPLDYTEEALERAKRAYEYLRSALVSLDMEIAYLKTFGDRKGGQVDAGNFVKKFEEAMNRDLHTPDAIAALHEFAGFINRSLYILISLRQRRFTKPLRDYAEFSGCLRMSGEYPLYLRKMQKRFWRGKGQEKRRTSRLQMQ